MAEAARVGPLRRLGGWFQERLPIDPEQLRELTNEPVPNHLKRWWFALGGTPAYLFVVQVVTGIVLAVYYKPAAATAYESVRYITEEAAYGWFVRALHKWGATLMIAAVIQTGGSKLRKTRSGICQTAGKPTKQLSSPFILTSAK